MLEKYLQNIMTAFNKLICCSTNELKVAWMISGVVSLPNRDRTTSTRQLVYTHFFSLLPVVLGEFFAVRLSLYPQVAIYRTIDNFLFQKENDR